MLKVPDSGVSDQTGDPAVTALLRLAQTDRRQALDALVPLVYDTLRRIARQQLARERPGHTLSATALAHEAYARLIGLTRIEWRDRAHFFAAAAGAMRRVLIDYAVARKARKRGGGAAVEMDLAGLVTDDRVEDVLSVHEALVRLERVHPRAARVVECRIFAGMTIDETAAALDLSPATVKRYWEFARATLTRELMHACTPR
ncbi:MAG: sigma-70 family RNA polymerase sigma factor [Acidobacteria bacterium]|nr:sigma-70 family RNA polymerase sigma factor [Acidobacteriota bacterium]